MGATQVVVGHTTNCNLQGTINQYNRSMSKWRSCSVMRQADNVNSPASNDTRKLVICTTCAVSIFTVEPALDDHAYVLCQYLTVGLRLEFQHREV